MYEMDEIHFHNGGQILDCPAVRDRLATFCAIQPLFILIYKHIFLDLSMLHLTHRSPPMTYANLTVSHAPPLPLSARPTSQFAPPVKSRGDSSLYPAGACSCSARICSDHSAWVGAGSGLCRAFGRVMLRHTPSGSCGSE